MAMLRGEDIAAREIAATGKDKADLHFPEMDLYGFTFLDNRAIAFSPKPVEYEQIDKSLHLYKSLCDSRALVKFHGKYTCYSGPKRTGKITMSIAEIKEVRTEDGTVQYIRGIQTKYLNKFLGKSHNRAVYYDPDKLLFWLMDLDGFIPYMVICGCQFKKML